MSELEEKKRSRSYETEKKEEQVSEKKRKKCRVEILEIRKKYVRNKLEKGEGRERERREPKQQFQA